MSALEARLLTEADYEQWDQLAEQSECGTIFHSSLWITTSARCLGLKVVMIGVFKGDHLVGGCFFYKRRILSLLPVGTTRIELSPYGGFLLPNIALSKVRANEGKRRSIVSTILEKIEKEKLLSLTITNSPNLIDLREFILKNWTVTVHYTYMIPLEGDIPSNVDRVVRDSIRKAQKHGIVVAKEMNQPVFWKLNALTFTKQGKNIPFQQDHLFNLIEYLHDKNLGELWLAKTPSGDPVSGVFVVNNSNYAHALVGASDPSLINTGAYSLLLLEIFQDYQRRGFKKVEIWGATAPHLAAFYSSFNPVLVPYYSIRRVGIPGRFIDMIGSIGH
jgi:hypothetical protein